MMEHGRMPQIEPLNQDNMKNVTEQLTAEHRNILRVIDEVLEECQRLECGGILNPKFIEQTIDFIRNYADKYHHAKEEKILFEAMLENQDCLHCNPIPVMLHEHEESRGFVRNMEKALDEKDVPAVIANAHNYCRLLQGHIYKEDHILYPMAEEALDELRKETVLQRYREADSVTLTAETVKRYETLFAD